METSKSQPVDDPNLEISFDDLLKLVTNAVHRGYRIYGHRPNPEDVKDIVQEIVLLLIKDDFRVLRSFEQRSSLETWLQTIARHKIRVLAATVH